MELGPRVVKILLLGDSGSGKTALMMRYFKSTFDESYTPTAGSNMAARKFNYKNTHLNVEVLELGGSTGSNLIPQTFHGSLSLSKGTSGIIFLYDSTQPKSFDEVANWIKNAENFLDIQGIVPVLCAAKSDLPRGVVDERAKAFAKENKLVVKD